MKLLNIIKRLFHSSSHKATMDYCYSHGFTSGTNFHSYSDYPIDSNYPWLISVGDNVTLAPNVKLLAHDSSTCWVGAHTKIGLVTIGNNVYVGMSTIVLCNVKIGDNVIIGANSVVTKSLPSNGVYAGNPAKFICSFEDYKTKHQKNLETHHYFSEHPWNEWKNATPEEWENMRDMLKDDFGYI